MMNPEQELERLRCELSRLRARAIAAETSRDGLRAQVRILQRLFRKVAFLIEAERTLGLTEQDKE